MRQQMDKNEYPIFAVDSYRYYTVTCYMTVGYVAVACKMGYSFAVMLPSTTTRLENDYRMDGIAHVRNEHILSQFI